MHVAEALIMLKRAVIKDNFYLVKRRKQLTVPVSRPVAKYIISQMNTRDFIKCEPNRNNPHQQVWIFKTYCDKWYYMKFVFIEDNQKVIFISFHQDY